MRARAYTPAALSGAPERNPYTRKQTRDTTTQKQHEAPTIAAANQHQGRGKVSVAKTYPTLSCCAAPLPGSMLLVSVLHNATELTLLFGSLLEEAERLVVQNKGVTREEGLLARAHGTGAKAQKSTHQSPGSNHGLHTCFAMLRLLPERGDIACSLWFLQNPTITGFHMFCYLCLHTWGHTPNVPV